MRLSWSLHARKSFINNKMHGETTKWQNDRMTKWQNDQMTKWANWCEKRPSDNDKTWIDVTTSCVIKKVTCFESIDHRVHELYNFISNDDTMKWKNDKTIHDEILNHNTRTRDDRILKRTSNNCESGLYYNFKLVHA